MNDFLNLQNVYIWYGKKLIINDVSFNIKPNAITTLIGPSGCGKTTLLKSVNRLLEEKKNVKIQGKFILKKEDIMKMPVEVVRKKIGMVFQQPTPFPVSIYKNMSYAVKYYEVKDKKQIDELIKEKLQLVGLYDEIKDDLYRSALKLSGGQQQRLCIARALTVEPDILLLDEPCSSLDIKNMIKIEEVLKNLSKNHTIIIVTHNLAQAKRISDYVFFMLDGEIVEKGSVKQIFDDAKDNRTKNYIEGLYG